jgi:hypothetical protein
MVVALIGQGSQPMSENDRVGARVVARLSAGVPTDADVIARLDGRWRALADELAAAQPEARKGIRKRHLDAWEDGVAMLAAILQANPSDDPFAEPVQETARQRFRLTTAADLEAMPDPEWHISGHIPVDSFVLLFGQTGSMKTFEGLELASCTASGTPWHGLERTRQGMVVYVAAEGSGGFGKRLRAWRRQHSQADLSRLHFITETVNLIDPVEMEAFRAQLRALPEPPSLVIWDTLARCMVGADENSSRDMGIAIAAMDSIRQEFGATVIPIHHTGKNGEDERGSSALRAAADTVIKMSGDGTTARLTCVKQKDAEEFAPITLRLRPVEGTESCVLEYADYRDNDELGPKARDLLELLDSHFDAEGASATAWLKVSGLPDRTFYRAKNQLIRGRFAEKKGVHYTLTRLGREAIGLPDEDDAADVTATAKVLPSNCHGSNPEAVLTTATTATTRKGGSGSSSDSGATVLSGRPGNGVYEVVNAATDDIGELP